jgi:hypothetical protein
MKRIITLTLVLVGAGLGYTSCASAQVAAVEVNVPFDFAVGNHTLPAGEYRISSQGNELVFENREQRAYLSTLVEPSDAATDGKSRLTFDVVQDKYYLRKVASTWAKTSGEFPASRLEKKSRELAVQQAKSQEPAQTRTIYVAVANR